MALHRSVTGQGTYILDKAAIQTFRTYRLAVIKEGPYLDIFRHPATLLRLANWLVDAVRDLLGQGEASGVSGRKKTKSLPFVLACLDQETDSFLVVGVIGAVEFGDVKKKYVALYFLGWKIGMGSTADHLVLLVVRSEWHLRVRREHRERKLNKSRLKLVSLK